MTAQEILTKISSKGLDLNEEDLHVTPFYVDYKNEYVFIYSSDKGLLHVPICTSHLFDEGIIRYDGLDGKPDEFLSGKEELLEMIRNKEKDIGMLKSMLKLC